MYNSLIISLWFLIFCSCDSQKKQKLEEKSPPNIIFILSDDQAWGDYSFMGHPYIKTPNIDQLASESATYSRGYVTSPLCGPSLASIITGKYAFEHNQTGNDAGNSGRDASLWIENGYKKVKKRKSNNYLYSKERNDKFDIIKANFYQNKLKMLCFSKYLVCKK